MSETYDSTKPLTGLMSLPQQNYIYGLLDDREPCMALTLIREEWEAMAEGGMSNISKQAASNLISRLKSIPAKKRVSSSGYTGRVASPVTPAPSTAASPVAPVLPPHTYPGPKPRWVSGSSTWRGTYSIPGYSPGWKPPHGLDLFTGEGLPRGRYAVQGKYGSLIFFKWDKNHRKDGIWQLRSQHGPHWQEIHVNSWPEYLDPIFTHAGGPDKGIVWASMVYAKETGRCYCCGTELTDPLSVALGIGPDCRGRGLQRI